MRLILIRPSLDMTCAHRLLRALGLAFVGMLTLQCALTTDHWAESSSARTRLCARSNDRIESTSEVRITNATDLQRAIEPSHKRAYDELIGRYVSGRAPVFRGHLDARYEIAEPVYADRCPATPTRVSGGALAAIEEHVPDNTYDRLLIANAEQTARVEIIKKRELNAQRVRVDMFLGTGRCALNVMSESSADDALFLRQLPICRYVSWVLDVGAAEWSANPSQYLFRPHFIARSHRHLRFKKSLRSTKTESTWMNSTIMPPVTRSSVTCRVT